jgi:hypothetical protein
MSTKEIKRWLQRLDISTAGCLERQDLALKLMAIVQVVHSEIVSEAGNGMVIEKIFLVLETYLLCCFYCFEVLKRERDK